MTQNRNHRRKMLYATILATGLSLTTYQSIARTVPAGNDMCGEAHQKRDQQTNKEIGLIKQTHEMMEISRSLHAQCMKQINEIVGEKISSIDSGDGSILSTVTGIFGQVNEVFNLSGKVCKAVSDRVSDEQKKIADAIGRAEPLLRQAGEIKRKGQEILDKAQPNIDKAIENIKKADAKKVADDLLHAAIEAGEVAAPEGYIKPANRKPAPSAVQSPVTPDPTPPTPYNSNPSPVPPNSVPIPPQILQPIIEGIKNSIPTLPAPNTPAAAQNTQPAALPYLPKLPPSNQATNNNSDPWSILRNNYTAK